MDGVDGERWRRVQELFEAVADLQPPAQAAFLDAACGGEAGLRQEVEALLRSDAAAGSFIEHAIRRGSELLLVAEPDPLESIGKVGKYEILGRIGEGGFGVVYKGRDPVLQRYVAVKTCSSRDEKLRRRFFREGQIAAGLQHPNITTVFDLGVERGVPYLVQEFLDGEDLNYKVARQEALTPLQRLDVLLQVARGLEYAHLQGVLHRDVKPANIRILPGGAVKIMDFGIAKLLHEVSDVTTQGMTLGTVGYLAPEQLRGEEVDRRTDIFAFGVLVYELLSYQRPFKGSTFSEVSYRLLNEEPRTLRELAPDYGPRLAELAARCLAKEPGRRPDSFGEVIGELEREIEALRSGSFAVPAAPAAEAAAVAPAGAAAGAPLPLSRVAEVPAPGAIQTAAAIQPLGAFQLAGGRLAPLAAPSAGGGGGAGDIGGIGADIGANGGIGRIAGQRRRPNLRQAAAAAAVVLVAAVAGGGGWALLSRQPRRPPPAPRAAALRPGEAPAVTAAAAPPAPLTAPPRGAGAGIPPGAGEPPSGGEPRSQLAASAVTGAAPAPRRAGNAGASTTPRPAETAAPSRNGARGSRVAGAGGPTGNGGAPGRTVAAERAASGAPEPRGEPAPRSGGREVNRSAERPATAAAPAAASAGYGDPASAAAQGGGGGQLPAELTNDEAPAGGGAARPGAAGADSPVDLFKPMRRGDLIPPGAPGAAPPRLVKRPEPAYPDRARRRRVEADVLMLVLVDENGRVVRAIVKSTDDQSLGFNEAARQAALRATFDPATRDGLPGKMWTELPFSFRLHG